uniref:Uncharacterized protein n=1 Tax=Anguilla anguilla TaxID=7936 RepID=A0A0E9TIV9_ANGAN
MHFPPKHMMSANSSYHMAAYKSSPDRY